MNTHFKNCRYCGRILPRLKKYVCDRWECQDKMRRDYSRRKYARIRSARPPRYCVICERLITKTWNRVLCGHPECARQYAHNYYLQYAQAQRKPNT